MGSNEFLAALRAGGAAVFDQRTRLVKARFPESSGIPEGTLLPHHLSGREGLSKNPRYTLVCLSPFAHLELKKLMGQPIEISLLLPDGGERLMTGIVTVVRRGPCDGGFCTYSLTVESALAALAHRRNSRNFQDVSVVEVVKAILDEHIVGNPVFAASFQYRDKLTKTYPKRSYCNQYRETDLAFIERLLAEEGITYRFSHGEDDDAPVRRNRQSVSGDSQDAPIVHTLILQDTGTQHPVVEEPIRFHRTDGVETADAIDSWEGERSLQSSQTSLATWDYKASTHLPAGDFTANPGGKTQQDLAATLEDYDPQTGYYGADTGEVERYANLRQLSKDMLGKLHYAAGTTRQVFPGSKIDLADHPVHDQNNPEDRLFVITDLQFEAQNNLTPEAQSALGGLLGNADSAGQNQPPYRNTFTAVRQDTAIVPEYQATRHQKPTFFGTTTATVVGPDGEEIYTDQHGRIKIQFHWQRPQDHPGGGANFDDRSSTWVRVAMPSADAQWGGSFIPRTKTEVVVAFVEGDVDRPLVIGVVYNGSHMPPTFSGAGHLPANKTLSGFKTKEYKGNAYNELLFDDSTGQMRAKLSSEHGKTQLNQGYLIHPRTEGKGEPRGNGFELRTDEAGAIRAAKGILLSAWQRLNAADKQLSREEALSLMESSLELFKQFGEYAAQHQALPLDPEPQQKLKDAFKDWENGSNTAPQANSPGGAPIIGMSAPEGLSFTTPKALVSYAGANLDSVAQLHMQLTAGQRFNLNAGKGLSLFSHAEGLKAIAHHGKLELQSQHDDTQVAAEQNIKLTASQGKIIAMAQQEVVLITSGGAYLKLAGPNIEIGGPGALAIKAASHHWSGPASMDTDLPKFSEGDLGRKFQLIRPTDGEGMANIPYKMTLSDGSIKEGITNAAGETELLEGDRFKIVHVDFKEPPSK